MPYTSNLHEMLFPDLTSRQTGKHEDNAFKATRASSRSIKGLARPPSIPPQRRDRGTINQSQWISIELECREEIGGDEGEVCKEGM